MSRDDGRRCRPPPVRGGGRPWRRRSGAALALLIASRPPAPSRAEAGRGRFSSPPGAQRAAEARPPSWPRAGKRHARHWAMDGARGRPSAAARPPGRGAPRGAFFRAHLVVEQRYDTMLFGPSSTLSVTAPDRRCCATCLTVQFA